MDKYGEPSFTHRASRSPLCPRVPTRISIPRLPIKLAAAFRPAITVIVTVSVPITIAIAGRICAVMVFTALVFRRSIIRAAIVGPDDATIGQEKRRDAD